MAQVWALDPGTGLALLRAESYLEFRVLTLLLLSCVDYDLSSPDDVGFPYSDSGTGEQIVDLPPEVVMDDPCPDDVNATFGPGEIYVKSWDRETDGGVLTADVAGQYHVYDFTIAESGASQTNESAYFRVANDTNPSGMPTLSNCRDEWVVIDVDNDGAMARGQRIYVGTFWLDAGDNDLTMHHFCPLIRDGACPDLHLLVPDDGTCDSGNVNSVHFLGEGLCLVTP
jgi:hypothetical protein